MRSITLPAFAFIVGSATIASAQLIVGTTTSIAGNPSATYIDPYALTGNVLWNTANNKKVNGLAADTANGRIYCNDAARLNFWNYGSIGTVPTFIAGMYRTNDNVSFTATGVNDMTWADGNLYGAVATGTTQFGRGIYRINTTPDAASHCVMTPLWIDPNFVQGTGGSVISPFGLEYNSTDGLFYFTNESVSTSYSLGIYTLDAFHGGQPVFLAPFPAGASTHVDGLTIGDGKIWLTQQSPSTSEVLIYTWDMTTHAYGDTFSLPLTDATQRASAAVWAPGANTAFPAPGPTALLGMSALLASRRRRA